MEMLVLLTNDQVIDIRTPRMSDWSCSSRYSAPFLCPLRISRRSTPKLKTSDFTENTPSNASSGAMYPLIELHVLLINPNINVIEVVPN